MAQTFNSEKGKPKGMTFDTANKKITQVEFSLMNKPFNLAHPDGRTEYGKPGDYLVLSKEGTLGLYSPEAFQEKYYFTSTVQTRDEFVNDPENQAAARELAKEISDAMRENWFNETELAKRVNMPVEEAKKKIAYCYLFGLLRADQHDKRGTIYKIELKPADQLAMLDAELANMDATVKELHRRRGTFAAVYGL
jgi:hypothetical protein